MPTTAKNIHQEHFAQSEQNGFAAHRKASVPRQHTKIELFNVQGLVLSRNQYTREQMRKVLWFKPLLKDIFVGSFPRAGGSWVQYIIWTLLHGTSNPLPNLQDMRTKYFPCIEQVDPDIVDRDLTHGQEGRLIHHHLPKPFVPADVKRSIYIIRNPYDVCVSYYHHLKVNGKYDGQFSEFFECFIRGEVPFGDYFDHTLSWYESRDEPEVKVLFYEQMMENPIKTIVDLADFIGVKVNSETVNAIASVTNIDCLKDIEEENVSLEHYRYAKNGDWKKLLTEDMKARLDSAVEPYRYTDMYKIWATYADL